MKAVILAAGKGSRLSGYTKGKPKCLLALGKETVLQRELRILQTCGICRQDIYVVGGYRYECLQDLVPNLIVNDDYDQKDNSYSLGLALTKLPDDDVLVLDADLCFEEEIIYEILSDTHNNVLLSKRSKDTQESTGIVTTPDGKVSAIGKQYTDTGYVYLSIFKIDKRIIPILQSALLDEDSVNTWYTAAVTRLCADYDFYNHVTDAKWHEMDDKDDYLETIQMFGLGETRI